MIKFLEKYSGSEWDRKAPYGKFLSTVITNLSVVKRLDFTNEGISITGITQEYPCKVTAVGHGLSTGDRVHLKDIGGMVQLNDRNYIVTVIDANTFTLDGIDSTNFTAYTSGGKVFACQRVEDILGEMVVLFNNGAGTLYFKEDKSVDTANAGLILKPSGSFDWLTDRLDRLWVKVDGGAADLRIFLQRYGEA